MITGYIRGQNLEIRSPLVAADTIDYLTAQFVFQTKDWDGCRKFAHWTCGAETYSVELDNDRIGEDAHLNLSAGTWTVWIHGERYDGGTLAQRITTDQAILQVKATGTMDGDPFPEVPGSAVERIHAELLDLRKEHEGFARKEDLTPPEIFWVQYEATTYEAVKEAVLAGKLCMMQVSGGYYQLASPGSGSPYDFYAIGRTRSLNWLRLWTDSTWTATNTQIITELQKASQITASTTGSNVPSVDAVRKYVEKNGASEEAIKSAVDQYLDENPVETDLVVTAELDGSGVLRADHTYADIAAAIGEKRGVRLYFGGSPYTFHKTTESGALVFYGATAQTTAAITIDSTDRVSVRYTPIAEAMTGATAAAQGKSGMVPAPAAGQQDMVLHGDGTWRGIEIPEIPESVPPGNLTIIVMGESLDELTIVSVQYPADAPEGYQPEDSIAAGNVVVMLALADQNGEDLAAMSMGVLNAVDNGAIQSHMNLVQEDAVTSLMLEADLVSMTARALVYTEFAGGGTDSGASGWVEILPETEGVNDDPDSVLIEIPAVLNVSPGDKCRVYWQGDKLTAEAEVTAVSGDFYGYPAVILADYTGDEFVPENVQTFALWYIPQAGGVVAQDKANSTRCTVRIEKLVGDSVTRAEFDALASRTIPTYVLSEGETPEDAPEWAEEVIDPYNDPEGGGYVLTDEDKQEIAEIAAGMVDVPGGGGTGGEKPWVTLVDETFTEDVQIINVKNETPINELMMIFRGRINNADDTITSGSETLNIRFVTDVITSIYSADVAVTTRQMNLMSYYHIRRVGEVFEAVGTTDAGYPNRAKGVSFAAHTDALDSLRGIYAQTNNYIKAGSKLKILVR